MAYIIPLHFIIVPYFTLWMLDYFNTIRVSNSLDPDQARHILGLNCLQRSSADIVPPADKELYTKQLVDTTSWLKLWLKIISFGFIFFYLTKVLATANS